MIERVRKSRPDLPVDGGFATILSLVIILVLALGMTVLADHVRVSTTRLAALDARMTFDQQELSTRHQIGYALAKHAAFSGSTGVSVLGEPVTGTQSGLTIDVSGNQPPNLSDVLQSWDDRYVGQTLMANSVPVEVLDMDGLIDLNSDEAAFLRFVARRFGVKRDDQAIASLLDYRDLDSFERLGGREISDEDESFVIANRPLASPTEICTLPAWQNSDVCEDRLRLARTMIADTGRGFLFATASPKLQHSLVGEGLYPGSQNVQWAKTSEQLGFFSPSLLGGTAGPDYMVLYGPHPDTGQFRRSRLSLTRDQFADRPFITYPELDGRQTVGGPQVTDRP